MIQNVFCQHIVLFSFFIQSSPSKLSFSAGPSAALLEQFGGCRETMNGEGLYFANLYFSWQSVWILAVGLPLPDYPYNLVVIVTTAGVVFVKGSFILHLKNVQ